MKPLKIFIASAALLCVSGSVTAFNMEKTEKAPKTSVHSRPEKRIRVMHNTLPANRGWHL